ncbi:hypothetical protein F5Y14DRAFT_410489 [Nemania sp. NC0429]|nr:hypothetical protein F5Y14DRAFT_410489 [Nemania sp. NC0429]
MSSKEASARCRIERWINSIEQDALHHPDAEDIKVVTAPKTSRPDTQQPSESTRDTKRARHQYQLDDSADELFEMSYNLPPRLAPPGTPPLSGSDPSKMKEAPTETQKRSYNDEEFDANRTPTANKVEIRPDFAKKRKRTPSPVKTVHDLYLLEKPVQVKPLTSGSGDLPEDIKSLCDTIQNTSDYRTGVFPGEIRDRIEAFADRMIPPHCFRDPNPENSLESFATFTTLCRIVEASWVSLSSRRYEDAWNSLVHTPLLDLIFGSHPLNAKSRAPYHNEQRPVAVRFEPVMSATIAYEWIPRLRRGATSEQIKKTTNLSDLACSISASSAAGSASSGWENASHVTVFKDLMHTSADSKKVDYVLVLDILDGTPLKTTISHLTQKAAVQTQGAQRQGPPAHVNQTTYRPIKDSPIAVSIETKQDYSSRDPLLQLSIWIGAWHRRMKFLYSARCLEILDDLSHTVDGSDRRPPIDHSSRTIPSNPKLVSLPLIVATGHQWQVYFACDRDSSIELHGPLAMGSTGTILDVYILLSSLQAIGQWVETTFYAALKLWFQCDEQAISSV